MEQKLCDPVLQTGAVSGSKSVGGLVGDNMEGTVTQCYSTGTVIGTDNAGGLVGFNLLGTLTQCYSIGTVSGTDHVGGLSGASDRGTVTGCFWDVQTSGQTTSAGGTGKTTAEMQMAKTFIEEGWNFVGTTDGPDDIWSEPEGGGYPILWWQLPPLQGLPRFSGGTGEPNDPYTISTPAN